MKNVTLSTVLLAVVVGSLWSQPTYHRKALSTIRNVTVASSTFSFEIWMKNDSAGTTFFVGNCDFYFSFNNAALINPTLSNINSKYTGLAGVDNYNPMQTGIVGGKLQVGIRYTGNLGGSAQMSTAEPFGELVCRVNMTIADALQTSQLSWDVLNSAVLTTGTFVVHQEFNGADNSPLPVQLAGFTGSIINQQGHVRLVWRTLTETNNYGFYVQKSQDAQSSFQTVSPLIPGHGTTLEPHDYEWTDVNTSGGTWYYRLKQVDLSGAVHYSESIQPSAITRVTERALPTEFGLSQNYPNPFNPSTKIEFAVPQQSQVKLELFNLLGQNVAVLVEAVMPAGYHVVGFNADGFSSGLYFYKMTANGTVTFTKKMMLVR